VEAKPLVRKGLRRKRPTRVHPESGNHPLEVLKEPSAALCSSLQVKEGTTFKPTPLGEALVMAYVHMGMDNMWKPLLRGAMEAEVRDVGQRFSGGGWVRAAAGVGAVRCSTTRPEMPNLEDLSFLFLCHSLLLALAFHPPGWGLVSDSGTMACLELLW
jgi:hypothetical protein